VLWYFAGNDRAAAVYATAGFLPDGARRPVAGLDMNEVRVRLATGASERPAHTWVEFQRPRLACVNAHAPY
jgi:hypothetical protein